ncbi:MAG: hypothetical protein HOV97_38310 [Nonomuraea sp.]|nr:hypothetical protein [Nonomuraea sp.]
MVLKFHRDALEGCAAAARSASGAFGALAGQAPHGSAFGNVSGTGEGAAGSAAMVSAVNDLTQVSGQVARSLGDCLAAVERALDAVERTVTSADAGAARR